jgi:hypothetical protein
MNQAKYQTAGTLVSVLTRDPELIQTTHTIYKASSGFHTYLKRIKHASIEYLDGSEPSILDTHFLSTAEVVKNAAQ